MVDPITRRKVHGRARELSLITTGNRDLMVWWYGGISKNHKAQSVPLVEVFFRELDERNTPGKFSRFPIALNHLGLLRIGSIWNDGRCQSEAILQKEIFTIDFSKDKRRIVSPSQDDQKNTDTGHIISQNDYPLRFSNDKNWLVHFPLKDGKNLLIPCLEFLVRCYGRSAELSRILATYPWDEVKNRFFAPLDQPAPPDQWPVKLRKRMRNGDVVFLAHALYDPYAQKYAKSIYAQLESDFKDGEKYAFIKVAPWFHGPAQIMVNGLWINDGQTFLGLQILGCSDPSGDPIYRDRENTNKTDGTVLDDESGNAWRGAPVRLLTKLPEIFDLTDDEEPDHGSASIEIEELDFIVLGSPRVVVDARRSHTKSSGGHPGNNDTPGTFSGGEHHGTGKGVGYASIYAKTVMESHGTLRDMWDAMLYLKKRHKDIISTVEWFTLEGGFCSNDEPELVSLQAFDKNDLAENAEELPTTTRNWPYHDLGNRVLRGVLVARMLVDDKPIYILEIQRRPRKKKAEKNGHEIVIDTEESFKGVVCLFSNQKVFITWLRKILHDIRYVRGVVQKLVNTCPGPDRAEAFVHAPASDEQVPCEAAVRNALLKMDIVLPD
ncbi:hypothetical protein [Acidithiobacillus ferriphilus]|jgi:hypothetical protein|uniref:hypothetical protein n=1 Tax=Acidithiobacillus ferriphilus TaxID=1689834 RepID=UPI00242CAA3D|nr:hypothetical protein [Acidithiobacillus ferriphilus]